MNAVKQKVKCVSLGDTEETRARENKKPGGEREEPTRKEGRARGRKGERDGGREREGWREGGR